MSLTMDMHQRALLIEYRNNKYDLRENDILKRPMAISAAYSTKTMEFNAQFI